MAVYPLLKFVTSVTAAPTVLLDLNDGNLFQLKRDGFSVGVPTYDGDPLSVGVRWGYRTLTMHLQCYGTNAAAMAEYGLLAQQITAETNLLMFQLDASSSPIFFTTYRTAPSDIEIDQVVTDGGHTKSYWDVAVSLLAEPFASGLRQDLTAVVIAGDPVAGTNPLAATLGTVLGDVPTPAYIYVATGGSTVGDVHLLGIDHGAATTGTPPADQGEGNTYANDGVLQAVASASSGNVARLPTTAASFTLLKRVTAMRVPTTEPGSYRLFARVKVSNSTAATWRMRYVETVGGVDIVGETKSVSTASTAWFMQDLGIWQYPATSMMLENGLTGVPLGRDTDAVGALEIARDTGTAAFDVDYVTAIPAYGDLSFILANTTATFTSIVWDGQANAVSAITGTPFAAPTVKTGVTFGRIGGLPQLWPGQVNRLWWVPAMGALGGVLSGSAHDITSSTTLNVSYWPRYLWMR